MLRSLRDLGLTKQKIHVSAADASREFDTPYGLVTKWIATDGIDIFVHCADDDIVRVGDSQRLIREVITNYLEYVRWDEAGSWGALEQHGAALFHLHDQQRVPRAVNAEGVRRIRP